LDYMRTLLNKKNLYLAEHPGAGVELAQRDVAEEARQLKIDEWVKAVSKEHLCPLQARFFSHDFRFVRFLPG